MTPNPPTIDELLASIAATNASELHLKSGVPPTVRIDGNLYPLEEPPLDEPDAGAGDGDPRSPPAPVHRALLCHVIGLHHVGRSGTL